MGAKEATVIDATDGSSWEVLGNSYLGDFFVNGAQKPDVLQKGLIAFEKAAVCFEKQGKETPFLYYNWGTALKFMENYELAIQTFKKAVAISPDATPSHREVQELTDSVTKVADLVRKQGNLKPKRLSSITGSIAPTTGVSLVELQAGNNKDATLGAKVVSVVDRANRTPIILVCCDANATFFALSVYNCDSAALLASVNPGETSLSVKSPHFRQVKVTLSPDSTPISYPSIRVAHPGDLMVAGGSLSSAACASAFKTSQFGAESEESK